MNKVEEAFLRFKQSVVTFEQSVELFKETYRNDMKEYEELKESGESYWKALKFW